MKRAVAGFLRDNWLSLLLTAAMIPIIAGMVYLRTLPDQTPREAALEEVILTAALMIGTFLVTKMYAERTYSRRLRDQGVQIAIGIMALKRQIEALSDRVAHKRELVAENGKGSSDPIFEHVERMLQGVRGMTDAALGGIAGVIGDALAQRSATERCPYCAAENGFESLNKIDGTRVVVCGQCRRAFDAH